MRVLLDECVPRALRKELPDHEVKTTAEAGWAGVKNGALLRVAEKEFDLLLTVEELLDSRVKGIPGEEVFANVRAPLAR